jgi:hypothetical protein
MTARAQPAQSPPISVVLPFFLLAPLGLIAAGFLATELGREALVAVNGRRTVAITHALALGWVTTTIMGACYQLAPVVLGGPLMSHWLARLHLVVHLVAVALFVWGMAWFNATWVGVAGSLAFASVLVFLVNVGRAVWRTRQWSIPRAYLACSTMFLLAGATLGLVFAGNLEHRWFTVSHGKLAAHAHLGLTGWVALTVMGVSYQLVPMFNVASRVKPRLAYPALALTSAGLVLFALIMWIDPPRDVRLLLAGVLLAGPLLWSVDQVRLLRGRVRRRMDIHGRGTVVSLCFLGLTVFLAVGAAWGSPFTPYAEPARWPLAYAAAGLLGWAGTAIIANSYKIVPFLIWFHRYRERTGKEPVPLIRDIADERLATLVLVAHSLATLVIIIGLLAGNLQWLQAGGGLLIVSGVAHLGSMLSMFLPKRSSRTTGVSTREVPM